MLFRNIEDFEDDLLGEKNKINLKGIDDTKFNIIIDQTNKSGILTGLDPQGKVDFPTCGTIKLPKGSTAEIQGRTGIKISCDEVKGMPYNKISCMDGENLAECCGKDVCSEKGGCYQIQYNQKTTEFKCVGGTPSKLSNFFGCDSNDGCIAATNLNNAMSQDTCIDLCKKYKKCDNKNLVTFHSTTSSNEYYDYNTSFPNNPCNLKNNTVQIKSKGDCNPDIPGICIKVPNVIYPKVCDLVKRNSNGCNDVNNGLNPDGSTPMKSGGDCDLNSINNIPFGVNVTAYGPPRVNYVPFDWCVGNFVDEKDMCPMKGNCGSQGNPQYFNYNNTGDLKETSCSLSFKLDPQNQLACD
uniref:Uncharacterized protein n=1 Tax=viral metagenome TaxID=1070528 RepID=A0A6C0LHV2_9ZZZZ